MTEGVIGRRTFLGTLGACAAAATGLRAAEARGRRPNVVVILTDDQGWGDIHSHGNEQIDTPVMDRLATEGARFDRFFVSPVCAPTRAAFLTGRYYLRTGTKGVSGGAETMRAEEVTVAEILKAAGYATGCFGKWHNGAHYPHHPNGQGFDEYQGICMGHWNNYFDTRMERNGEPHTAKGYVNDALTDAALSFIDNHKDEPFFCYVPYNTPHTPCQVPDRYFAKYKKRGLDDYNAAIYGMVESLDDNLGRLLKRLEELKLAERTLVVFFTDNGPNGRRFNGGMKGAKGSVHEGGVRVPCFIRWPGRIKPGTEIKAIAAHIDLLPTLVQLTGVPMLKTKPLDGLSLAPLLLGMKVQWVDRMLFEGRRGRGAVRTQRYRFVVEGKKVQLYDMQADPGQQKNLAKEQPGLTRKLKAAYDKWIKEVTEEGGGHFPIPVGHAERKLTEMTTPEGTWSGGLKFGGRFANNNWLTNWTKLDATIAWDIDVVHAGPYEVSLRYICPKSDLGSKVRVTAGGASVVGIIDKAKEPNVLPSPDRSPRKEVHERDWGILPIGTITLPKGRAKLTIQALTKPGKAVMDLKALRLRRMD